MLKFILLILVSLVCSGCVTSGLNSDYPKTFSTDPKLISSNFRPIVGVRYIASISENYKEAYFTYLWPEYTEITEENKLWWERSELTSSYYVSELVKGLNEKSKNAVFFMVPVNIKEGPHGKPVLDVPNSNIPFDFFLDAQIFGSYVYINPEFTVIGVQTNFPYAGNQYLEGLNKLNMNDTSKIRANLFTTSTANQNSTDTLLIEESSKQKYSWITDTFPSDPHTYLRVIRPNFELNKKLLELEGDRNYIHTLETSSFWNAVNNISNVIDQIITLNLIAERNNNINIPALPWLTYYDSLLAEQFQNNKLVTNTIDNDKKLSILSKILNTEIKILSSLRDKYIDEILNGEVGKVFRASRQTDAQSWYTYIKTLNSQVLTSTLLGAATVATGSSNLSTMNSLDNYNSTAIEEIYNSFINETNIIGASYEEVISEATNSQIEINGITYDIEAKNIAEVRKKLKDIYLRAIGN